MSGALKNAAVRVFLKFFRHRDVMQESDRQYLLRNRRVPTLEKLDPPYGDVGRAPTESTDPALFITGRFRSGSTLLWNLFRHMDGCTSFYEPFNERRWFDASSRGERVDTTHRGVDDYWREYDGISGLAEYYRENWIRDGLFMDENTFDPDMRRFIDRVVASAKGHAVLQFNRVDFRLPWLRKQYPQVPIIHIYRHPRDQWLSFLTDKSLMNKHDVASTYRDAFYLDTWCRDLARHFPFLDSEQTPHPYRRFYYLWKLSWLFGKRYAACSVAYEDLVTDPRNTLEAALNAVAWPHTPDWDQLSSLISRPALGTWHSYAEAEWFVEHERHCEETLSHALGSDSH